MVKTVNENHARLFALHGSPSDAVAFHKEIAKRLRALGQEAVAYAVRCEPFAGDQHDAQAFDLNARAFHDWAASVSPPEKGDHPAEAKQKESNIELLGRLAATLTQRFGPARI